jgi:hypothetical protein
MELEDLDGDGHEDTVIASLDGSIWWLRGTGLEGNNQDSFVLPAERLLLEANTEALSGIRVTELNGDGHRDLALTTASGALAVYLGGPTGSTGYTLRLAAQLPVSVRATKILAHDVDADGDADLIVAGDDVVPVSIALNGLSGSTGSITLATTLTMPHGIDPMALTLLDMNGDEALDLAVARRQELIVFTGQTTPPYFVINDTFFGPEDQATLSVGDVNNDGFDDLIATEKSLNSARNGVEVYFGRGLGLAPPVPLFELPIRARAAVSGLFNADDVPDVAFMLDDIVNFGNDLRLVSLVSEKAPTGPLPYFSDERSLELVDATPFGVDARLRDADFNGDGIVDLVFSGPSPLGDLGYSGNISVMMGEGRAGFGSGKFAPVVKSFTDGAPVVQLEVADLNGDQRSDVVLVRDTELIVALSSGTAQFTSTTSWSVPAGTNALIVADVTNDGIHDLLLGYGTTAGLSLYIGNGTNGTGDGTFAAPVTLGTGGKRATTLVLGHFDGDDFIDIIFRSPMTFFPVFASAGAQLLRGQGGGAFAAPQNLGGGVHTTLHAIDVNHDGFLDLVSAGDSGGAISVRLGLGGAGEPNGTFAAAVTYPGHPQSSTPGPVYVTDADLDGVNDLIAFTQNKREIMMLKGLLGPSGPSGFAPPTVFLTGNGVAPASLVVRDFNGDDIPDWAVINQETPMLSFWYGQYQKHQAFSHVVRDIPGSKVRPFGANVSEPDSGLMGTNLGAKSVIFRPAFTQSESHDVDAWNSLIAADRSVAYGLQAITEPWVVDGLQKARRVPAPPGFEHLGARLTLFNRFGPLQTAPQRAGLSLTQGRGLIAALPLNGRLDHSTLSAAIAEQRVIVYKQARRFASAAEVPGDPLQDARYLPRGAASEQVDRILLKRSWRALDFDPDGFGSGSGERFMVTLTPLGARTLAQTDIAQGSVDVLLEEAGTLQAFVVPQ